MLECISYFFMYFQFSLLLPRVTFNHIGGGDRGTGGGGVYCSIFYSPTGNILTTCERKAIEPPLFKKWFHQLLYFSERLISISSKSINHELQWGNPWISSKKVKIDHKCLLSKVVIINYCAMSPSQIGCWVDHKMPFVSDFHQAIDVPLTPPPLL